MVYLFHIQTMKPSQFQDGINCWYLSRFFLHHPMCGTNPFNLWLICPNLHTRHLIFSCCFSHLFLKGTLHLYFSHYMVWRLAHKSRVGFDWSWMVNIPQLNSLLNWLKQCHTAHQYRQLCTEKISDNIFLPWCVHMKMIFVCDPILLFYSYE